MMANHLLCIPLHLIQSEMSQKEEEPPVAVFETGAVRPKSQ